MPYTTINNKPDPAVDSESETIAEVLTHINVDGDGGIFLPYIQRDFVWREERIYKLLDSLMRGYPIGTILVWETNTPVNYRRFQKNYVPDTIDNDFDIDDGQHPINRQYILDGQQRLQSLYIAMHGSYDEKPLKFDLAGSNPDKGYFFNFSNVPQHGWVNVREFLSEQIASHDDLLNALGQSGITPANYTADEMETMCDNAQRLYDVFKTKKKLLFFKCSNMPISDIAEVFIRTNSGAVMLEPEDFIMATMSSDWISNDEKFSELMRMVSDLGFDNPKAFIIQACYAILLQKTGNSAAIKAKFLAVKAGLSQISQKISNSITDVLQFVSRFDAVRTFARAHYNPVFILIAYHYEHGRDEWEKHKDALLTFLLVSLFCRDFVNLTQAIINQMLAYVMSGNGRNFSLGRIQIIFANNNRRFTFDPSKLLDERRSMTSSIAPIVMYLVYHGQAGYDPATMTVRDHIFPRSILENHRDKKGRRIYNDDYVNSILNCELLTKEMNSMEYKGDRMPDNFFIVDNHCFDTQQGLDDFINLHAIPTPPDGQKAWTIQDYKNFLVKRKELLIQRITNNFANLITIDAKQSPTVVRFIDELSNRESNTLTLDD